MMSAMRDFVHSEQSEQKLGQLDLKADGKGRLPGGGGFGGECWHSAGISPVI